MTPVDQDFDPLRQSVRGTVIVPADDAYDKARRVWNAMIDRPARGDRQPAKRGRCDRRGEVLTTAER